MKLVIIFILISILITMVMSFCVERSQYNVIEKEWDDLCKKLGSRPFTFKHAEKLLKEIKADSNFKKIFAGNQKEINEILKVGQQEMEKNKKINYCNFKETGGNKLAQAITPYAMKGLSWCNKNKSKIERYLKMVNNKDSYVIKTFKEIAKDKNG